MAKNVQMTIQGNMLTIHVDLSKSFGPSKSGKTLVIATTEGNVSLPSEAPDAETTKIGLNIYKAPPK